MAPRAITTSYSVRPFSGLSGGAVGSSQSPNWKPGVGKPLSTSAPTQAAHAAIDASWRRSISRSPNRSYTAAGAMQAASPNTATG